MDRIKTERNEHCDILDDRKQSLFVFLALLNLLLVMKLNVTAGRLIFLIHVAERKQNVYSKKKECIAAESEEGGKERGGRWKETLI